MSGFPNSRDVPCPWCKQPEGEPCITAGGNPTVGNCHHVKRFELRNSLLRGGAEFVVRIRYDDKRLGVKADEEYRAVAYWLDTNKVSLVARIPDGYDPSCNQYARDVEFVRWAGDQG